MALYFLTEKPSHLLSTFRKLITDGHVVTWDENDQGHFTHCAKQWANRAWLKPSVEDGKLVLYIWPPKHDWVRSSVYAVYHGRFAESMLVHCDKLFTKVEASALPEGRDRVRSITYAHPVIFNRS